LDTQSVRAWNKPQPDTFAQVNFPRPFVASPRLLHGIRQFDEDKSAPIRVRVTIENITEASGVYHVTSWADTTLYSGIVQSLNLAPAKLEFLTGERIRNLVADPNFPASTRINFERSFVTPPKVVFFNLIDLDHSKNWRLTTTATDIDKNGFTLNIGGIVELAKDYRIEREYCFSDIKSHSMKLSTLENSNLSCKCYLVSWYASCNRMHERSTDLISSLTK
jgi:hypothetical protein